MYAVPVTILYSSTVTPETRPHAGLTAAPKPPLTDKQETTVRPRLRQLHTRKPALPPEARAQVPRRAQAVRTTDNRKSSVDQRKPQPPTAPCEYKQNGTRVKQGKVSVVEVTCVYAGRCQYVSNVLYMSHECAAPVCCIHTCYCDHNVHNAVPNPDHIIVAGVAFASLQTTAPAAAPVSGPASYSNHEAQSCAPQSTSSTLNSSNFISSGTALNNTALYAGGSDAAVTRSSLSHSTIRSNETGRRHCKAAEAPQSWQSQGRQLCSQLARSNRLQPLKAALKVMQQQAQQLETTANQASGQMSPTSDSYSSDCDTKLSSVTQQLIRVQHETAAAATAAIQDVLLSDR